MTTRRAVFVAAVLAGAVMFAAVPARAGAPDPIVTLSKHKEGPYSNSLGIKLKPGHAKDVYVQNENAYIAELDYHLLGPALYAGYKFRYFKGAHNITAAVTTGVGHPFSQAAMSTKRFRIHVKLPGSNSPATTCIQPTVKLDANGQTDNADLVLNPPILDCS